MPLNCIFSQGLIPDSDRYLREYREDLSLTKLYQNSSAFLGYVPTSFERPSLNEFVGVRAKWLGDHELSLKPFSIRPSLSYLSLHENPKTIAAMGTSDYPITHYSQLERSQGSHFRHGENLSANIDIEGRLSDWAFGKINFQFSSNINNPKTDYFIKEAYAETRINSFVISLGRKPIYWGQSNEGALLLSDNAQNFDMLQISSLPFRWPWFFEYLGDLKSEFFISRTHDDRKPRNDYFMGWRVGIKPAAWFEGNLGMIYQFGGKGIDSGPTSDFVLEILGIRRSFSDDPHDSSNATNRGVAGDLRFNITDLDWPTSLYTEHHLEDCCGRLSDVLEYAHSYNFGVLTRTSDHSDASRIRIEYANTGTILYYHETWPASTSNEGRIAGSPLGRDAQGVYLTWSKDFSSRHFEIQTEAYWEERDKSGMIRTFDDGNEILITRYKPDFAGSEKRTGLLVKTKYNFEKTWFLDLGISGMHILNKEYSRRSSSEWGIYSALSTSF